MPLLNKNLKELVASNPTTDLLFGSELTEKNKVAKNLESVGKDLKPQTSSNIAFASRQAASRPTKGR